MFQLQKSHSILILSLIAALLPGAGALADDCVDYSDYRPYAREIATEGYGELVERVGDLLIVAEPVGRWRIFDVSDDDMPQQIWDDSVRSIELLVASDSVVCLGVREETGSYIYLYSIEDPRAPSLIQRTRMDIRMYEYVPLWNIMPHAGQFEGDRLYLVGITDYRGAWWTFERNAGGSYDLRSALRRDSTIGDIAVVGDRAYCYSSNDGICVLDVSDPTRLLKVANWGYTNTSFRDFVVRGNLLYSAGSIGNLVIWDISSLDAPVAISAQRIGGSFDRMELRDGELILADAKIGLCRVDVGDPAVPRVVSHVALPGGARDVALASGGRTWAYTESGLWLIGPEQEQEAAQVELQTELVANGCVHDGRMYSCAGMSLTIQQPLPGGGLDLLGQVELPMRGYGVFTDGSLAVVPTQFFVLDYAGILVDVSDPRHPSILDEFEGHVSDAAFHGDYALLCMGDGVRVVDRTDPDMLRYVEWPDSDCQLVEVRGDRAFVVVDHTVQVGPDSLLVYDLTTLPARSRLGGIPVANAVGDMSLRDSLAYLAAQRTGLLQIVDVATDEPRLLNEITVPSICKNLDHRGRYSFAATRSRGLMILDFRDPRSPVETGHILGGSYESSAVLDGSVYVWGNYRQIRLPAFCTQVLEVSIDVKPDSDENPINCRERHGVVPVALLSTPGFDARDADHTTVRFGPWGALEAHANRHGPIRHEQDVDGDGDVDLLFHFRVAEIGIECGQAEAVLTGTTWDGTEFEGTDLIRTTPRREEEEPNGKVVGVAPNPFNPSTTIAFKVDSPQRVRIAVYDLRGYCVAELVDQDFASGEHGVIWRGQDSAGRSVPSGTYFFRIQAGDHVETRKAILLK